MTIPDFQQLMTPLLRVVSDGEEHATRDIISYLSDEFHLTEADRKELLPSARQPRMTNRVHWTIVHLGKALLLQRTGRGRYRITDRGRQVLASNPDGINLKFLTQFQEYVEFRQGKIAAPSDENSAEEITCSQTSPEELLDNSYRIHKEALAAEVLSRILKASPEFFEQLVVDLLVAMGYGGSLADAGKAIGRSGDGGIDGIIKEDKLGLDAVYIQAKRWQDSVGRPVVQQFSGSLGGVGATKGVLITTSTFTRDAIEFASRIQHQRIVLIDGQTLASYMIDHNVGVTPIAQYSVKKVDLDFFEE